MGRLSRGFGILVAGALGACNAITGADGLAADPASSEADIAPSRSHREQGSSSGDPASGSSSSSSSSSSGGTTVAPDGGDVSDGGGSDAPPVDALLFDAFERPDGPTIGNGWTEKTDRFSIVAGAVRQSGLGSYRDQIVRRPATEDALDVEVSIAVVHDRQDGDPGLYVRMQPGSDAPNQLVGYTMYAYTDYAFIDRDDGTTGTELASAPITPALPLGTKYSFSFRVTGTNPVKLEGVVRDAAGNVVAAFGAQDGSAKRIATPGGVGFGSGDADGARFDDFRRVLP